MRVDKICQGCELVISGILLIVNLLVMDMSEFNVILRMGWLTGHRVVIDCESRRVTTCRQNGTRVTFQGDKHDAFPYIIYDSRWPPMRLSMGGHADHRYVGQRWMRAPSLVQI